jgi:predicted transposase/invertase (TIGR01784 family)
MKNKFISPLYDFAFAEIFGNQQNIENTRGFLKALLDIPEDEYDRLAVVSPILGRLFRRGKTGIVDLKLTTKSGKIIHIELQVKKSSDMKNRVLYYGARLVGDQLKWGDKYGKLHQVVSIVICDHVLLEEESAYMNVYKLKNEKNNSFTDMFRLVILELPKLPETEDRAVWPWLRFLKCKEKEEYEMLAKKYPELEKPIYCAKKMSLLEKWRDIQFHKNLWKEDERMLLKQAMIDGHEKGRAEGKAEGMAEGKAEGKAEGLAEAKLEVSRKMKNAGLAINEIMEFTGLSQETIEQL